MTDDTHNNVHGDTVTFETQRPTVEALERLMFEEAPVLDHGFIRLIDYMGDESAIVQAARVSYGKGTKTESLDEGLIRYLLRARHTTPFEMCQIKFHIKMPIFVARQWIRQRMSSVNEYSARYSILDREFYLPEPSVLAQQSKTNKQGRGEVLTAEEAEQVLALLHRDAMRSYDTYEELLNDQGDGTPKDESLPQVARELARMNLSLNFYTQWYWKIDLHNLMHFLGLRMDAHAQYEIRVYANQIGEMVKAWVPNVWTAFEDYRLGSASFSRPELEALRLCFQETFTPEQLQATRLNFRAVLREKGCSVREIKAFMATLGLAPKE